MRKFRKKPVVIEAFELTEAALFDITLWPEWLRERRDIDPPTPRAVWVALTEKCLYIQTLEGTHRARPTNWIVKGVKDEIYPVRDDIFEQTYEEVT